MCQFHRYRYILSQNGFVVICGLFVVIVIFSFYTAILQLFLILHNSNPNHNPFYCQSNDTELLTTFTALLVYKRAALFK